MIERGMQPRRIGSLGERRLREHAQSNDWLRPRRRIVRATPGRPPQDGAGLVRQRPRERAVDAYESVGDELFDLRSLEPIHYGRDPFMKCPHRMKMPSLMTHASVSALSSRDDRIHGPQRKRGNRQRRIRRGAGGKHTAAEQE